MFPAVSQGVTCASPVLLPMYLFVFLLLTCCADILLLLQPFRTCNLPIWESFVVTASYPMILLEDERKFFSKVQLVVESLAELRAKDFKLVIEKGESISPTTSQKNEQKFQRIDIEFIGFDADELVIVQLKGGRYLLATSNEYLRKLIHFGGRGKNYLMLNDTFRTVDGSIDNQEFGIMAGSVSNIRFTSRGSWSFRIFGLQKFTLDTASGTLNVTANISVKPLVSRSRLVTIGLSSSMDHSRFGLCVTVSRLWRIGRKMRINSGHGFLEWISALHPWCCS